MSCQEDNFEVTISVKQEVFTKGSQVIIDMTVKNKSDKEAKFCDYHTPFEGIANNIFTVTRNGIELSYQGIMKKRAAATHEDYINLKPNEEVSCSVDLKTGYELFKKGDYNISFTGNDISGLPGSNEVSFKVK